MYECNKMKIKLYHTDGTFLKSYILKSQKDAESIPPIHEHDRLLSLLDIGTPLQTI